MVFKWNAIQLTVVPLKGTILYANVSILLQTAGDPKLYQNPGF